MMHNFIVIPAKAGIQLPFGLSKKRKKSWTPAYAGVTAVLLKHLTREISHAA